jgi:membrane-bound lytic murein transglycosylase D
MRKLILLFSGIIVFLSAGLVIGFQWKKGVNEKDYQEAISRELKAFAIEVPDTAAFAGEKVPTGLFYVHEALDRELLTNVYWHSSTILMLKRAYRFFPVIEPMLKQHGIPDDFKFISLVESNLTNTISPSGATGFWQFLKETGLRYGLEITDEVDERYNLAKATEAACKYFNSSFLKYNNWTLTAASYNAGPENISKPLEIQKTNDFYDLMVNPETSRYIYRILAIKEIFSKPVKYGFIYRQRDLYPQIPCKTIAVDSSIINLTDFAKSHQISYKLLKELNPWLRKNALHITNKKTYSILIPDKEFIYYQKLWGLMPDSQHAE